MSTFIDRDPNPEGTCQAFLIVMSWSKELDQGLMDSDKNRQFITKESNALLRAEVGQRARKG